MGVGVGGGDGVNRALGVAAGVGEPAGPGVFKGGDEERAVWVGAWVGVAAPGVVAALGEPWAGLGVVDTVGDGPPELSSGGRGPALHPIKSSAPVQKQHICRFICGPLLCLRLLDCNAPGRCLWLWPTRLERQPP